MVNKNDEVFKKENSPTCYSCITNNSLTFYPCTVNEINCVLGLNNVKSSSTAHSDILRSHEYAGKCYH